MASKGEYRQLSGIIFIRLHSGDSLFWELQEVCKECGVKSAVVLSGVGMLESFELGYFRGKGDYAKQKFEKPHELVALSGLIIREEHGYNFHLHAALADEEKILKGGHLFSAKVAVTAEIVLLKSDAKLKRVLEKETGLMGLELQGAPLD